jgi:hypothetical protein
MTKLRGRSLSSKRPYDEKQRPYSVKPKKQSKLKRIIRRCFTCTVSSTAGPQRSLRKRRSSGASSGIRIRN